MKSKIPALITIFFMLSLASLSPLFQSVKAENGGTYINENESSITIGNDYIEIVFDKNSHGGIDSIIDKKTGIDLRPDKGPVPTLFLIFFYNGTATEGILQWMYPNTEYLIEKGVDYSKITIINSNLKGYNFHATTTITIYSENPYVEMRLKVENNENFIIENIYFPVIWGLGKIGSTSSDDSVFFPTGDGMLLHDPLSELDSLYFTGGIYPGELSMQVLCHYDKGETGLYFAAYDIEGNPKKLNYGPLEWDGINHLATSFEFLIPYVLGNDFLMDYNVILGTFNGDWDEAASMYKEWAISTPFISGGKVKETKDIPDWFFDTSIIQLINRDNPDVQYLSLLEIADITNEFSTLTDLDTTVLIIGWEKNGAWVGPDYYPPIEGDTAFINAMNNLNNNGNHGFTYISGTVWRITRDDIGYSDFEFFNSTGLPWVALNKDQSPLIDSFYSTIGWKSGRMCPMTYYWHNTVVENALKSVRLGCDVVQIDEFPIGAIYPCYNASHNHPVGYSNEISYSYQSILEDIRTEGRIINPNFIISTEEPCEFYLPYIDTYVSRDCAPEGLLYMAIVDTYGDQVEFIPFFSFVYHEYVTSFGEGIGLDKNYANGFYNQMARSLARIFTSGEILKVGGTTPDLWDADLTELFKRTATATTTYAKDYLINGIPLMPPPIDVPEIKIDWYNSFENKFGTPVHEPAVINSVWRADDGSIGYFFVNWYESKIDFDVDIEDDELPLGNYAISFIVNGERSIIHAKTNLPKTIALSLNPNDVVLIEIVDAIDTNPPDKPEIDGPSSGKINTVYTYTVSAYDTDGDDVSFFIDWGDGSTSGWTEYHQMGAVVEISHEWMNTDNYIVKVKAKDINDVEGQLQSLEVNIPKNKDLFIDFIKYLFVKFPFFIYFMENMRFPNIDN